MAGNMLISGQILLPDATHGARISHGQVLVEGERIGRVAVGSAPIGTADLGSEACLISPGFIDTHLHLPQFDCIGIDGLTLLDWLEKAVFPTEARWSDAVHAGEVTERVVKRLLAGGTTGIAAYATVHQEGTRAAMGVLERSGLRAFVGQVLMDQNAPSELLRPAAQLLREAEAVGGAARGRVQCAVTPRFALSCSEELLVGCGELARRTGWAVQTHLAETVRECELVSELFTGESYVGVYEKAGLHPAQSELE